MPPHRHSFRMTTERVFAAQRPLARVLWARQEALQRGLAPVKKALRWTAFALSGIGLALTLLFAPPWRHPETTWAAIAFASFLPVFGLMPAVETQLRRWRRGRCARSAERMLAPIGSRAPFEIEYAIDGDHLRTCAKDTGAIYELRLSTVGRAIACEGVVCLFSTRHSVAPFRVLYAPSDAESERLLRHLREAGALVETVV